jgi:hypothetical protein
MSPIDAPAFQAIFTWSSAVHCIARNSLVNTRETYNREFKIYDAAGSTTRSEFQLKNER